MNNLVTLTECPRDAMQGLEHFVPTDIKIEYLRRLLMAGFPILDFGSFVSPKAIPQMVDTAEVLEAIAPQKGNTKLLAIIANQRGAEKAIAAGGVDILGFPLSISEEFQLRNTGKSISEALVELEEITQRANDAKINVTVYLSMAFGNPYNEIIPESVIHHHTRKLIDMGVTRIALSDTVGRGDAAEIARVYTQMVSGFPQIEWICHLHAKKGRAAELALAATQAGCRSFDSALGGFGGCPLSGDALIGNLDTNELIAFVESTGFTTGIDLKALAFAHSFADKVFYPDLNLA